MTTYSKKKLKRFDKILNFFETKMSYQKEKSKLLIVYITTNIIQHFLFDQKNLLLLCKTL